MARNRMIKPEFWEDDKLGEIQPLARLLFIALWNFADDEGYLEYRVKWLKTKCLPYDEVEIPRLIQELSENGRIEIQNNIIRILKFKKHQRIDKPKPSDLSEKFNDSKNDPRIIQEHSDTKREEKEREEKTIEVKENTSKPPVPTPAQNMRSFVKMVEEKNDEYLSFIEALSENMNIVPAALAAEIDKFYTYWTELNPSGKKQRWELQKVFEVKRRLSTWFQNASKFSPAKKTNIGIV